MDLDLSYPALSDLRARCQRKVPKFVWEYLDSANGSQSVKMRNRTALDSVCLRPAVLRGYVEPDLGTSLLGTAYNLPAGIAPIGMSGLIWPGAEQALARLAAAERIPYCLSTVATRLPEEIGPMAGEMGWFQLYPPRDPEIRRDIVARVRAAGFRVLVLTVDVPGPSRRERQRRAQLSFPPRMTPRIIADLALHPEWSLRTLANGTPRLRLMEGYFKGGPPQGSTGHAGYFLRAAPDWDYLAALREEWQGPLVIKGVLEPDIAARLRDAGADAIWVSNHGGRQFDGAPAAIDVLSEIRAAVGPGFPLVFDSGVESGLDVLRALALGADFVMLGRAWHYALGAFGARGAAHFLHVLREQMRCDLMQLGARGPGEAAARLMK